MRVGALQSGYLPWLGFFEQVFSTDLFIIYNDMQYNRYSWRNRNYIKGSNGKLILTVPVNRDWGKKINEVTIDNSKNWKKKHLKTLIHSYRVAPYFKKYEDFFNKLYEVEYEKLIDVNMEIILFLIKELGIKTKVVMSSELGIEKKLSMKKNCRDIKTERIIMFMKELNADEFYEGAAGKDYIDDGLLRNESIKVIYQDYKHPVYNQQFGKFIPYLSAIDLLFNHGEESLGILSNENQCNK